MTRLAERRWTHDRSEWAVAKPDDPRGVTLESYWDEPGPWHDEPDKVQWVDEATDYACLAVRNHLGAWCGYVGVPDTHPYYKRDYSDLDVEVHGGLTFADLCHEEAEEGHGICHIPEPGHPDNVWWLGFDCGHAWDYMPRFVRLPSPLGRSPFGDETYRTLEYVQSECERLAAQLKGAE